MISKGASSGIVITDQQLSGKGQRGRKWVFQGGKSVAFSFFSNHDIDSNKIGYLPILSGLAVSNALAELNVYSQLKWPNDIIVNGKKIGGILCESTIRKKSSRNIVIGIGMNINQDENDIHKIIPTPVTIDSRKGTLLISDALQIYYSEDLKSEAKYLRDKLKQFTGKKFSILQKAYKGGKAIVLRTNPISVNKISSEAYIGLQTPRQST